MPPTDDLLFEESYLTNVIPGTSLGLTADNPSADGTNLPAAIASAAYGYTRGGLNSPLYAALFGFFGWQYPLISTMIVAVDAVFLNNTPAAAGARSLYAKHGSALRSKFGFSGLSSKRRCRNGYRRKHGMCVRH